MVAVITMQRQRECRERRGMAEFEELVDLHVGEQPEL